MNIENKEQLIRIVSQVGNGAHVFAPKEWVNEEVLIVRLGKKTVKEKIFEKIYPHLDKIIAVLLYGSNVSAAGTAGVIESIAKVEFTTEELKKIVAKTGGCMVWNGVLGLSPADDKLIKQKE